MTLTPLVFTLAFPDHTIINFILFVVLDVFVIMPNHVHGIIIIDKPVETQNLASLPQNKFGPQSKNLASIVRGYKIGVTKFSRNHDIPFQWQPRYHDHVIRNADELERIQYYVRHNPQKWTEDRYYEGQQL